MSDKQTQRGASEEFLRRADADDVSFISKLYMQDMRGGHFTRLNAPPEMMFGQAIAKNWLLMSRGRMKVEVVVYMVKDGRAGFAIFKQEPGHRLCDRRELWFFSIAPAYRGRGVGSRFLDAACARLAETSAEISARTLEPSTRMAEMLSRRAYIHNGREVGWSLDGPIVVDNWLNICRRRPSFLAGLWIAVGRFISRN